MRGYGQIQCSFWTDPDVNDLSSEAKLIALYLLTGPHSNGLGCYRIPDGYLQTDLKISQQAITKGFAELLKMGFAYRCQATNFALIPKFMKWNPIANHNVARAREKEFQAVPKNFKHYSLLCQSALEYGDHLSDGFETVLKRYAKPEPNRTDPEPIQNLAEKEPSEEGQKDQKPTHDDEAREIVEYLNAKAGTSHRHCKGTTTLISARIKEGATVDEIKRVIDMKCDEWLKDPKMVKHLVPGTLFRASKYSNYAGMLSIETPEQRAEREYKEMLEEDWSSSGNIFANIGSEKINDASVIDGEVVRD